MCQLEQKHFSRGVSAQDHAYCPAKETRRGPTPCRRQAAGHITELGVYTASPLSCSFSSQAPPRLRTTSPLPCSAIVLHELIVSRANSYLRDTPRLMRFFLDDQVRGSELPLPAHFSRSQVSASLHHLGHVASGVLAHGTLCCMCQAPARP